MNAPLRFHLPEGMTSVMSNDVLTDQKYSIPYARSSSVKWESGTYAEQVIIQPEFGFCLLNFHITRRIKFGVEALQSFTAIQFTLRGEATAKLNGHGYTILSANSYTHMYIPSGGHAVWFEPGSYTFFYMPLAKDHLQVLKEDHPHLEALIQRLLTYSTDGIMIERMIIDTAMMRLIERIQSLQLSGAALKLELQQIAIMFISVYHHHLLQKKSNGYNADEFGEQIKLYIIDHINEPSKTSIQSLTQHFHTTERTLERHFKRNFHQSLRTYIKNLRLDRAHYMILEKEASVSQIAEDFGYVNVYNFSKEFIKRYGYSPKHAHTYSSVKSQDLF